MLIGEKARTFINSLSFTCTGASQKGSENSEKQLDLSAYVSFQPRATHREVTSKSVGELMEGKGHFIKVCLRRLTSVLAPCLQG